MAEIKTIKLEFGAWEPDMALLNGQQVPTAKNVIPAKRGYRSYPGIVRTGSYGKLYSRVYDALSTKDLTGELVTAMATKYSVFMLENGEWRSRFYQGSTNDAGRTFVQFGNDIFCLFGDTLYQQPTRGADFARVQQAPYATCMGIIRDFLVLGGWSGDGSDWYRNGIRWSGIDRPDQWPTPGSNAAQAVQSDTQIFPEGGKVTAIVGGMGGIDGLIFLERGIQRATYVGTPYFFQFDVVDRQQGTIAPKSPVVCGQTCYYLSEDGWKATNGSEVKPIGIERVDEWFFSECEPSRIEEIRGVHDIRNRLAIWSFPSRHCCDYGHDRLLIYSYALDKWSMAVPDRLVEVLYSEYGRSLTLEDLDPLGDLEGANAIPYATLDDPSLRSGGRVPGVVFVNVDPSGNAPHQLSPVPNSGTNAETWDHLDRWMGSFTGAPLDAYIDTVEHGGERLFLHGFRPLVDSGNAQAAPRWRHRQMDPQRMGKYTKQNRDGICWQHLSVNYLGACIYIPSGTWTHAIGAEALVEPEGWY